MCPDITALWKVCHAVNHKKVELPHDLSHCAKGVQTLPEGENKIFTESIKLLFL